MEKIKKLTDIYFTLDRISVSGEENCRRIVNCRQLLAQIINEMEKEAAEHAGNECAGAEPETDN